MLDVVSGRVRCYYLCNGRAGIPAKYTRSIAHHPAPLGRVLLTGTHVDIERRIGQTPKNVLLLSSLLAVRDTDSRDAFLPSQDAARKTARRARRGRNINATALKKFG